MTVVARLLLVPVGLLLALLAFVHSASETGRLILPVGFFGRSGIDAHVTGEFVDRLFRAEMRAQQAHALAEQGQLSEEEIATLAADPVALQRFIEERQTLAQSEPDHFPEYRTTCCGKLACLMPPIRSMSPLCVPSHSGTPYTKTPIEPENSCT